MLWKPQPHPLSVDWLGLIEPARCESCSWAQRRGPAAREDKARAPGPKTLSYILVHKSNNPKSVPLGRYRPAQCGNPIPIH